jgi:hypothetical protein
VQRDAVVGQETKRRHLAEQRGLPPEAVVARDPRRFGGQFDAALATMRAPGLDRGLDAVLGATFHPAFARP